MQHFRAARPDSEAQWVLDLAKAKGRPRLDSFASVIESREQFVINSKPLDLKPIDMAEVIDHRIKDAGGDHKMLVRDYRPKTLGVGPAPALLYLHGGGWVVGSPETHDGVCRLYADVGRCRVFSVDYRMGPEHRYPASPDDSRAAWNWLIENAEGLGVDAKRIAVGGDSAGGNLSAVLALELRKEEISPCLQALIYPATDLRIEAPRDTANDEGYLLDKAMMDWFIGHYMADRANDAQHWRASPILAKDLSGAPPAYLVTCGFDPLGVQGALYGDALRAAGVKVTHAHYPGALHGFFGMAGALQSARSAVDAAASYLREALAKRD